jgi:DNA-binding MarR family transcriptional regulator
VNEQLLTDDDVTLYGLFMEAFARLRPLVHRDLGVPDTWFEVLLRLGRTPGHRLRMTDLTEAVSFSSCGFTRLADRVAKEGLIRRDPDPADRRAALAALTDQGAEALDRALTALPSPQPRHRTALIRGSPPPGAHPAHAPRRQRMKFRADAQTLSAAPGIPGVLSSVRAS